MNAVSQIFAAPAAVMMWAIPTGFRNLVTGLGVLVTLPF